MEWVIRPAGPQDRLAIADLLARNGLPQEGAAELLTGFEVASQGGRVVACGGLEYHGDHTLLRSLAVADEQRGLGLGGRLVTSLVERARGAGAASVVLLTETAAGYFPRFGFRAVEREAVPVSIKASVEYSIACADSAQAMILNLA